MKKLRVGDLLTNGLAANPEIKVLAIQGDAVCIEVLNEHRGRDKWGDKTINPVTWYKLEDWENASSWSVEK